jgi:hypothetical protein
LGNARLPWLPSQLVFGRAPVIYRFPPFLICTCCGKILAIESYPRQRCLPLQATIFRCLTADVSETAQGCSSNGLVKMIQGNSSSVRVRQEGWVDVSAFPLLPGIFNLATHL